MVPRNFPTTADWLAALLHRWARKGDFPNVVSAGSGSVPTHGLEDGERAVALVRTADGREFVLTGERIVERGHTVLRYVEIVRCHWITDHPDTREHVRLKESHDDRLVLDLVDGRKVVLERLGPAVFPLLRFLDTVERYFPRKRSDSADRL